MRNSPAIQNVRVTAIPMHRVTKFPIPTAMIITMTMTTITTMNEKTAFLKVVQALDSLFPIGAFTLSNGMETYVQREIVTDRKSLSEFLRAYLYTLPTNDAGFVAKASMGESPLLLDEIYAAAKSPYELRNGSRNLCRRFIKTEAVTGQYPLLQSYGEEIEKGNAVGSHPVALGLFIRDTGADIEESIALYCYSQLSAMVNHAAKLVPLSQLQGQSALAEMFSEIPYAVNKAMRVETDNLGIGGAGFDLRSMEHEKLYSRIYIS